MERHTHLFRSDDGDYRAIGVRGAPAHTFVQQIFDVLETRLSRRHRQLFAEPVVDESAHRIDWWSDLDGPVSRFADLPEDRKDALRADIEDRIDAIQESAAALRRAGRDDASYVAELLTASVRTPGESTWFVVGDHPVLALWAHETNVPHAAAAGAVVPMAVQPTAAAAADTAPTAEREPEVARPDAASTASSREDEPRRRGRVWFLTPVWAWWLNLPAWLRWLLLTLLLLLLLSWLLRSCVPDLGLPGFGSPDASHPDTQTSAPEKPAAPEVPASSEAPDAGAAPPAALPGRGGAPLPAPQGEVPQGNGVVPPVAAVPGTTPPGAAVAPVILVQLEAARAEEMQLRAEIARLEAQVAARQQQCGPAVCGADGTPLPVSPQAVVPNTPPVVEPSTPPAGNPPAPPVEDPVTPVPEAPPPVEPKPEHPPTEQPKEEQPPAEQPPAEQPPSDKPPAEPPKEESRADCPAPRPSWDAPEIVVVFDTSGSMALPANIPASQRDALLRRVQAGDANALVEFTRLSQQNGNQLIDTTKRAIGGMVRQMPKDVDIGYIEFGQCDQILNHSFYGYDQRDALIGKINQSRPQKGTPLARAIERAGNIIRGDTAAERSTIVVVTDGFDSCGGNPCAAAQAVARAKPGVTINVVNLGDDRAVQCISQNGRGRTLDATADSLSEAIVKASEEKPVPEHCR